MAGPHGRRGQSRAGASAVIDPITLEVVREALSSIVREMRVTLVRTAYSSILYEGEDFSRSEEHTSELQSRGHLVCRLLLEKINSQFRNLWPLFTRQCKR